MPGHILCYAISYIDNNTRITSSTLTNVSLPKIQVLHMLNYYNVVLTVNMSPESHKNETYSITKKYIVMYVATIIVEK